MDRADLERLDRESLVVRATDAGIRRARLLTRPELIDEMLRLDPTQGEGQLKKTRGFFGIARDLLTKVVERGLHLPDAADRWASALGGSAPFPQVPRPEPQVVPTVTLAEIYAAQGHKKRAIETLRRVLEVEPEHSAARALLDRLEAVDYVPPPPPLPPEPDEPVKSEIGAHLGTYDEEEEDEPYADTMEQPIFRGSASLEDGDTQTLWLPDEAETLSFLPGDELVPTEPAPRIVVPVPVAVAEVPDHDMCVAIPLDAGQVCYVWWKLGASTRARLDAEPAFLFLRAVSFVPSWDGPVETVHDLTIDPAAGEAVVRELPRNGIVRIAIGTRDDGVFVPLAHSPALETAGTDLVEWTPEAVIRRGHLEDPRSIVAVKSALARLVAQPRS